LNKFNIFDETSDKEKIILEHLKKAIINATPSNTFDKILNAEENVILTHHETEYGGKYERSRKSMFGITAFTAAMLVICLVTYMAFNYMSSVFLAANGKIDRNISLTEKYEGLNEDIPMINSASALIKGLENDFLALYVVDFIDYNEYLKDTKLIKALDPSSLSDSQIINFIASELYSTNKKIEKEIDEICSSTEPIEKKLELLEQYGALCVPPLAEKINNGQSEYEPYFSNCILGVSGYEKLNEISNTNSDIAFNITSSSYSPDLIAYTEDTSDTDNSGIVVTSDGRIIQTDIVATNDTYLQNVAVTNQVKDFISKNNETIETLKEIYNCQTVTEITDILWKLKNSKIR
jgi:hypothetical protein